MSFNVWARAIPSSLLLKSPGDPPLFFVRASKNVCLLQTASPPRAIVPEGSCKGEPVQHLTGTCSGDGETHARAVDMLCGYSVDSKHVVATCPKCLLGSARSDFINFGVNGIIRIFPCLLPVPLLC